MQKRDLLQKPEYKPPVTVKSQSKPWDGRHIVACVWCKGPANYTIEHVLTLKRMVDRHLTRQYDFVCLTDHVDAYPQLFSAGIKPLVATSDVPGWWQKPKLFCEKLWRKNDHILYLDLDVVIVNNLDEMFDVEHHTVAIANFGVNFRHSKYNSSVVLWRGHGPVKQVFHKFYQLGAQKIIKALHGDQCWLWRVMEDTIETWPDAWVQSYKYETRRTGLAPDTKIVVYHGDPKPWDCNDPISKEYR